jgi:hypothetical protein
MNQIINNKKEMQMKFVTGELQGLRKVISFLWDGEQEAFNIVYFLKSNYKEWPDMLNWLKRNNLKGKDLVQMFQNESPDGGGYHMGATYILNKLKGNRFQTDSVKIGDLL